MHFNVLMVDIRVAITRKLCRSGTLGLPQSYSDPYCTKCPTPSPFLNLQVSTQRSFDKWINERWSFRLVPTQVEVYHNEIIDFVPSKLCYRMDSVVYFQWQIGEHHFEVFRRTINNWWWIMEGSLQRHLLDVLGWNNNLVWSQQRPHIIVCVRHTINCRERS